MNSMSAVDLFFQGISDFFTMFVTFFADFFRQILTAFLL